MTLKVNGSIFLSRPPPQHSKRYALRHAQNPVFGRQTSKTKLVFFDSHRNEFNHRFQQPEGQFQKTAASKPRSVYSQPPAAQLFRFCLKTPP